MDFGLLFWEVSRLAEFGESDCSEYLEAEEGNRKGISIFNVGVYSNGLFFLFILFRSPEFCAIGKVKLL